VCSRQGGNDAEASERAGRGDDGAAHAGGPIKGMLRTTYFAPERAEQVRSANHAETNDAPEDVYRTNIQIGELNALNAALAVIRFKQLRGFYVDDVRGSNLLFDIRDLKTASDG
jgi:hypothetical protein